MKKYMKNSFILEPLMMISCKPYIIDQNKKIQIIIFKLILLFYLGILIYYMNNFKIGFQQVRVYLKMINFKPKYYKNKIVNLI